MSGKNPFLGLGFKSWSQSFGRPPSDTTPITYGITISGNTFALRSTGTVNYDVDWGDGSTDTSLTSNAKEHSYADGSYSVAVTPTGVFRPYIANNADGDRITSVVITAEANLGSILDFAWKGASFMTSFVCPFTVTNGVTNFTQTWRECTSLTSFPLIDTSSGTDFGNAWRNCTSLTSFPLLNTSSGTNFNSAWTGCSNLTSFPLIDTSSGTNFAFSWKSCTSLTSFPLLNTSSGTNFNSAWSDCSNLTSFPLIDTSIGTNFSNAWNNCSSLTTFPANMFNSTGTLVSTAFTQTWSNCALTAQSIENILTSLDTNGASGITLNINGGTNAAKTTWSAAAVTAYDNLITKGWTIYYNA